MTKMYTPEYLAYRETAGLMPSQSPPAGAIAPAESGWTWNSARTKVVAVEAVRLAHYFNFNGDRLEGKGRTTFSLREFWATEEQATAELIAHHRRHLEKLKKEVASTEKKIAKLSGK